MTDFFDLVYLRLASNVQRMHLCPDDIAASRMLETFRDVGGDVPEYFSS